MQSLPLVYVGIVTWNSDKYLPACLQALSLQSDVAFKLVVVDNASIDNSLEIIKNQFPAAPILRNLSNTGFCHAHNQAILASTGKYYMALNPDIEIEPGYLSALVRELEKRPQVGAAAGKLLLKPKSQNPPKLDSTGLFINRSRRQYLRGHGEIDHGQYDQPGDVFGVDGAAPLYRREMLEDIKIDGQYFDESFFAHKEDVDLAWRARLLGWGCWYTPEAVAFHERNFKPGQRDSVSNEVRVHAVKNRYYLLLKNELPSGWLRDGLPIMWYDLKIIIYLFLFERSSLKAFCLLWKDRARVKARRQEIMQRRRVQPKEMLAWFR
jgi:GT2 family glycosyltransferase